MIELSPLILILTPVAFPDYIVRNEYAESIPYESLYVESKPNKSTLNYNTITTEELVREQNEKILEELFRKEAENEYLQHNW